MLTKIDTQLEAYDARVGSSLQMISCDSQGRIPIADLQKALNVIKHKPDAEIADRVVEKLDVDKDGFVELEHVLGLVREEGLGASYRFCPFSRHAHRWACLAQARSWTMRRRTSSARAQRSKTANLERRISYRSNLRMYRTILPITETPCYLPSIIRPSLLPLSEGLVGSGLCLCLTVSSR